MAVLIVRAGPLLGQRYEVETEVVVGRSGPGIVIDDVSVSRRHAIVRFEHGLMTVQDMGSVNGTFVNGARIDTVTPLGQGDLVEIGPAMLEVEIVGVSHDPSSQPGPGVDPDAPFGTYAPISRSAPRHRPGRVASRQLLPELVTMLAVASTAIALVLYFALR